MADEKIENLLRLSEEIRALAQALELLHKVYSEIGPYGDGELSKETRYKINDFFGFDDSE